MSDEKVTSEMRGPFLARCSFWRRVSHIKKRVSSCALLIAAMSDSAAVPQGAILAMCNPLLDISAEVPTELLEKCVDHDAPSRFVSLYLTCIVILSKVRSVP
jgi:hypothetical protein